MEDQLSKKEEYELRRVEKKSEHKDDVNKKSFAKILKIGILIIAVVGFLVWLANFSEKRYGQGPEGQQFFQAQARVHIDPGDPHPAYNSNPPTGGWHYPTPIQSGIYDEELIDEQIVHNLEHGHIWITYRADLDQAVVNKLADIANDVGSQIVMSPRPANNAPITLSAWQYLLELDSLDEDLINQFIRVHRGVAGPEQLPDHGFDDFRTHEDGDGHHDD